MAAPCVGEFWGAQYYADEEFHARLVLSVVGEKEVIVATPDMDVYEVGAVVVRLLLTDQNLGKAAVECIRKK